MCVAKNDRDMRVWSIGIRSFTFLFYTVLSKSKYDMKNEIFFILLLTFSSMKDLQFIDSITL